MEQREPDVQHLVNFLGLILRDEGRSDDLALLRQAKCSLDDYHWDLETSIKRFLVTVPASEFIPIRGKIEALEKSWWEDLRHVYHGRDDLSLHSVKFICENATDTSWKGGIEQPFSVSESESAGLWKPDSLRLFVCHKTEAKTQLSAARTALTVYGIDAFLAHTTIEPDEEWRNEIRRGLQTCDAMVAVFTAGVNASQFCQQELGWAMGRGVYVLRLLAGEAPLALAGDIQGMPVPLDDSKATARGIAKRLRQRESLAGLLFRGIAQRLRAASTPSDLWYAFEAFKWLWPCPESFIAECYSAISNNVYASQCYGLQHHFPKWCEENSLECIEFETGSNNGDQYGVDEYDPFAEEYDPFAESATV